MDQVSAGPLGVVVGGALSAGVDVRLGDTAAVEEAKAGTFVTVQGNGRRFFGIITDLALASADPRFASTVTDADPAVASVLSGTTAYAIAKVRLDLATPVAGTAAEPARSLPGHFAPVHRASSEDVAAIFGTEDAHHIYVGSPLDMEESRVCLDLAEFVKRSNAVFGKSGSGKSYLTRILLAGIVQKAVATNLVFDMHNEYGWASRGEGGHAAKGLKQLFPTQVVVFTLDEESSRSRGVSTDFTLRVGLNEIEPEDVAVLAQTLRVTDLGVQACYALARELGDDWVTAVLDMDAAGVAALADRVRANPSTLDALRRGLGQLRRLSFMVRRTPEPDSAVRRVLDYLQASRHVVLEFGRYNDDLTAYVLVANLLTRRIYADYRARTERALASNAPSPSPLVITIEEAHKYLTAGVAEQTIFGTIAREMRKYSVTLLVVDQRPSGIDEEVRSQLGTRVVFSLDNERDVDAVMAGAHGAREMKTVLARLEPQQQSLMFGHALPMPVVVRTRSYDTAFYAEVTLPGHGTGAAPPRASKRDLFG